MFKVNKRKSIIFGLIVFSTILTGTIYLWVSYLEPKLSLFHKNKVYVNFKNMKKVFPSTKISHSSEQFILEDNLKDINEFYYFNGKKRNLQTFFTKSNTSGFLVVKSNRVVYEKYFQGYSPNDQITSFSVAKSFIATLIGIALDEKLIRSIDDAITDYVPELRESGFNNVPIKHILQMSSGIDFSEKYDAPSSDAFTIYNKMFLYLNSIDDITASLKQRGQPGKKFHYASINTHALSMLIRKVTGMRLTQYLEKKIWKPLKMEGDAYWLTDMHGTEIAFWGLNARLRDFAKLGMLYINNGKWLGKQILSSKWIEEATTPDRDYLEPGKIDNDWGYQYQWWIPRENEGDYSAIGIWGQFIYVHPEKDIVIVKTSADPDFKTHEYEAIVAFRSIAEYLYVNP